jgi:hypothetical protein
MVKIIKAIPLIASLLVIINLTPTIIEKWIINGFIIYQEKQFSISFLVHYHNFIIGSLVVAFVVYIGFLGWKAYSFIKGLGRANDPWDAYLMIYIFMPILLWLCIFKILSEPTPILPLIFSLIIFVPLAIFLTRLSINFIKCVLSDWYIRW